MPLTINLLRKRIKLTGENSTIVDIFQAALECVTPRTNGDEATSGASMAEVRDRRGFWARYVLRLYERVSERKKGSTYIELKPENLQLDPPAEILLAHYIDYLNQLFVNESIAPAETEKSELDSRYAVLREFLIRLVSVALSNNLDAHHDGESLMTALAAFVEGINQKEILLKKSVLGRKRVSTFLQKFATTHQLWVDKIRAMIEIINSIHANSHAISDTLDQIKLAKSKLQMQLVVFLKYDVSPEALSDSWSYSTWRQCEKRCVRSVAKQQKKNS